MTTALGRRDSPKLVDSVVDEVQRNGYIILERLFEGDELARLRAEAERFLLEPQPWYPLETSDHHEFATISPLTIPTEEEDRVRGMSEEFSARVFQESARRYLHPNAYVDRIIVHRERPSQQPVTEWHADQQADGRESFKFMLYFNDVSAENAAFSYVPASHKVVKAITAEAIRRGRSNQDVHNFEQMKLRAREYEMGGAIAELDRMSERIGGDYASDQGFYSLAAPAGSVILFDTKGVHRGGVVASGERFLMRVHTFEPIPRPSGLRHAARSLVDGVMRKKPPIFW